MPMAPTALAVLMLLATAWRSGKVPLLVVISKEKVRFMVLIQLQVTRSVTRCLLLAVR